MSVRLCWLKLTVILGLVITAVTGCSSWGPNRTVTDYDPTPVIRLPEIDSLTSGVQGHVTAPDGTPISLAIVGVQAADEQTPPVPESATGTNQQGHYQRGLPPGNYTVTIYAQKFQPATKPFTVSLGQQVTVNFVLTPE